MAGNLSSIKQRIRSIQSTRKTTKAMEVVANAKLAKAKKEAGKSSDYTNALIEISNIVLSGLDQDCVYTQANPDLPKANIIITSDMGLCGGYNANVFKEISQQIKDEDYVYSIGSKGTNYFRRTHQGPINTDFASLNSTLAFDEVTKLVKSVTDLYINKEVGSIKIIYTEFVNNLTFKPRTVTLLPIDTNEFENIEITNKFTIFEPSPEEVLDSLIPMYLQAVVYGYLVESATSENASRRTSMENATDNAEELTEQLLLKYNQARQTAITNEVSEIVAGANAQ